jgi:uncharacterized protein YhdP
MVLRYAPKVGMVTRYQATMSSTTAAPSPGMQGQAPPFTMNGSYQLVEKVLSEKPGSVRVERQMKGWKMSMPGAGPGAGAPTIPDIRVVLETDRRGRGIRVVSSNLGQMPGAARAAGQGMESWADLGLFPSVFPEGEVKPGDKWAGETALPLGAGMGSIVIKSTSKLLGEMTYEGRKCAKVEVTSKGSYAVDLGQMAKAMGQQAPQAQQVSGTMNGSITGRSLYCYDPQDSIFVYREDTMNMTMDMKMRSAGANQGPTSFASKMSMTQKTKLLPEKGKAPKPAA